MEDTIVEELFDDVDGSMLLELSISNLNNNVKRDFGPDREQRSNRIQVTNYQVIPSVSERSLLIKARIVGEESNYQTQVRFSNVTFGDAIAPGFAEVKAMDGNDYFVRQFTASQTQARVRCSCLDFHYRFSVWNHTKKSLEGDPPKPYVKKTDRPPVNPNRVAGACKHIMKLITFLKGEGIVR